MSKVAVKQSFRGARFELRSRIKRMPVIYMPFARVRNGRHDGVDLVASTNPEAVRRDTQLVLEAAGSSGNTFAVIAFRSAQGRPVSLAHHLHAAAQVQRGVRRGIPTLVIIRSPESVATSRVIRHAPISLSEALREWLDFYQVVEALRPGILLADFDSVITDFGRVVDALNERFDTDFGRFDHTPENVAAVFSVMDDVYRCRGYPDAARITARPVAERERERAQAKHSYRSQALCDLRGRADDLFGRLTLGADV
jgi:hypothetical protein